MAKLLGWMMAGGLILGAAAKADAQIAVSVGNPWYGRGVYVGGPAYGYPPPVVAAPIVPAPIYPAPVVGVGVGFYPGYPAYRPYYGGYGYGYGYGPRPWGHYRRW